MLSQKLGELTKKSSNKDELSKFRNGKWKDELVQNLGGYTAPVIVNGIEINELEGFDWESVCYCYMDFVKSGRHHYTINSLDKFYLHSTIIRNREQDIVHFNKKKAG
jgi:hypothetical protein